MPDPGRASTEPEDYSEATHSFVVKVWLEAGPPQSGHVIWRGHVTHVSSGRRRYFQDLDVLAGVVAHYLEELGIASDPET